MQKSLILFSVATSFLPFVMPKSVVHGLFVPAGPIRAPAAGTHPNHANINARDTSQLDINEAYNNLLKLLRDIYGPDVGKVLQDPEWLAKVCLQVCDPDDYKCQESCEEKPTGYLNIHHIHRCATLCEGFPHDKEDYLKGEYGRCLMPCLSNELEHHASPQHTSTPLEHAPMVGETSQSYPYPVTLIAATGTTVFNVTGPAPTVIPGTILHEGADVATTNDGQAIVIENTTIDLDGIISNIAETGTPTTRPIITPTQSQILTTTFTSVQATYTSTGTAFTGANISVPDIALGSIAVSSILTALTEAGTPITEVGYTPSPTPTAVAVELLGEEVDPFRLISEDLDVGEAASTPLAVDPLEILSSSVTPTGFYNYTNSDGLPGTLILGSTPIFDLSGAKKYPNATFNNDTQATSKRPTLSGSGVHTTSMADLDFADGASTFEVSFSLGPSVSVLFAVVIGFGLIMG